MPDDEKPLATPLPHSAEDWRKIAEQASKEMDPGKLLQLVQDLCTKLDERNAQRNHGQAPKP